MVDPRSAHQRVSRRSSTPTTRSTTRCSASAATYGDHPALVDGVSGQTITYAQLDADAPSGWPPGFAELGVRKGDVVALHSPNTVLYPVVFYAATRAGATVTTLSTRSTPRRTWPTSCSTARPRW